MPSLRSPGVSAQTKVSIANLIVSSAHLPLWIAGDQGLFAGHGIVAEIRIVNDAIHAITPDTLFGVIGVPAAISAMAEGRDLKAVATLDSARVTGHLVAGRDIKTPGDLRGKRIGVNRIGTGAWIHSILALNHLGLDPTRDEIRFVEIMSVPQRVRGLEAGVIDATVVDPGQSAQLRAKGFNLLLDMYPADIQGVQSALGSAMNHLAGGRLFPGEHHHARFTVREGPDSIDLAMQSDDGEVSVIVRGRRGGQLAASSCFSSLAEASAFFEPGSVGYSVTSDADRLDGIELRTQGWSVEPLQVEEVHSSYFADEARFPKGSVEFDCALVMRNIGHEWHSADDLYV